MASAPSKPPSSDIPAGIPSFLLPHFDRIAKAEGLSPAYCIEQQSGAKPGDGFMSDLIAVTLVDTMTEQRIALVCKLQPQSADRKEHAAVFQCEIFAYTNVFPAMLQLQQDKGLTEESNCGFFAIPKCYAAIENNANLQSFIVMADMRTQGYAMWPKEKTVEFEHVKELLIQLGRFHGLSFVMRDQRPEVFAEWMKAHECFRKLIKSNPSQSLFDSTYRRAGRLLERPADRMLMERIRVQWRSFFLQLTDVEEMGEFAVYGHGDCWNNNLLYSFENVRIYNNLTVQGNL